MEYSKKLNILCFELEELSDLFKQHKKKDILNELRKNTHLLLNPLKLVDSLVEQMRKNKEEVEVFVALSMCSSFYGEDSKICFQLKDGLPADSWKEVRTFQNLKDTLKEYELTDFTSIDAKNDKRDFQLKIYYGKLQTEDLFNFIKNKIEHYANNLGDVNLLVQLRGSGKAYQDFSIDFKDLHAQLTKLGLKFQGQVLLSFNEDNKFKVINQVYPELTTSRTEWKNGADILHIQ